jgi:HPt (histidine-containing phosphotransfer) domain-containing protein
LYQKLLNGFAQQHSDFANKITSQLDAHQKADAQLTAHTFKGIAGSVGAMQLYEMAGELESLLEEPNQDPEPLIKNIRQELAQVMEAIKQYLHETSEQNNAASVVIADEDDAGDDPQQNLEEARAVLRRLKTQLDDYDTAAEDSLERLLTLLPEHKNTIEKALDAIDDFDFEVAEEVIGELEL